MHVQVAGWADQARQFEAAGLDASGVEAFEAADVFGFVGVAGGMFCAHVFTLPRWYHMCNHCCRRKPGHNVITLHM